MEEKTESYCGGCSGLKGKLVQETDVWRWRLKEGVNIISEDDALQQSRQDWRDGDGPVVGVGEWC